MYKRLALMLLLLLLGSGSTRMFASVLDFEGLTTNPCCDAVPNGYGGLNWANVTLVNKDYSPGTGYQTGTFGNYSAFNGWGQPLSMTAGSGGTFTLNSAYFTSAWFDDNVVTLIGYENGLEKYTTSFVTTTAGPILETFNWSGIDTLNMSTSEWQVDFDNMTINETITPEPTTLLLLGTGLVGLAGVIRRKMRA